MSNAMYPWDDWVDGEVHALRHSGESAEEDLRRFRNTLYMWAKRNEQGVRTLVDHDEEGSVIRFQMIPKDSDATFSSIFHRGLANFEPVDLTDEGEIAV